MNTRSKLITIGALVISLFGTLVPAAEKLKVLLIDGQNNHNWESCEPVLKWALEECGRFVVAVSTAPPSTPAKPKAPKQRLGQSQADHDKEMAEWKALTKAMDIAVALVWQQWHPKFRDYDVLVSNYNGEDWPEEVRKDFVEYVRNGGGLVSVHAADNSFPGWPEYNEMIAVGGWGGRNEKSGPMVRWRDGKVVFDTSPGGGGTHGAGHEFLVETRAPEHPIMKGLPAGWRHASDELYAKMRGPAKNLTVLATAKAEPGKGGTEENEPILMAITYGKGRMFHTTLGHDARSMSGLGFQVTLQRGTEWAATGQVTLPAPKPEELPADKAAMHPMPKK